jgi:hypothetical protein
MAVRPVWKGQLRLSLVSIPVEMYSATNSSSTISFRQIHKPSGKPVRYEKVVPGIGPVDADDIWKGYEVESDEYVLIEPDEIDRIKLETKKTLELIQFVDITDIPPIYFDKPYFLAPTDELAEDAFRVVRDALAQSRKAGLGQLAMRGREYLVAVRPCGSGLLARDAALRAGDQEDRPVLLVHLEEEGGQGTARSGEQPDREEVGAFRRERLQGPLCRRHPPTGGRQVEGPQEPRRGRKRKQPAQGRQCGGPDVGAEEEPRRQRRVQEARLFLVLLAAQEIGLISPWARATRC